MSRFRYWKQLSGADGGADSRRSRHRHTVAGTIGLGNKYLTDYS